MRAVITFIELPVFTRYTADCLNGRTSPRRP